MDVMKNPSEDRCNVHTHPLLMDFRSEGEGTCRKIPSQLLTPPLLHAALSLLTHSWRHKNKVGGGTDGRTISIHFAGRDARCPGVRLILNYTPFGYLSVFTLQAERDSYSVSAGHPSCSDQFKLTEIG